MPADEEDRALKGQGLAAAAASVIMVGNRWMPREDSNLD
jgi:hypothetical protein